MPFYGKIRKWAMIKRMKENMHLLKAILEKWNLLFKVTQMLPYIIWQNHSKKFLNYGTDGV